MYLSTMNHERSRHKVGIISDSPSQPFAMRSAFGFAVAFSLSTSGRLRVCLSGVDRPRGCEIKKSTPFSCDKRTRKISRSSRNAWQLQQVREEGSGLGDSHVVGQNSQVARWERPIQQKATSLPNWRSLIGDPALALVGEYRTKEKQNQKKSRILPTFHTPSADWRCRLVISPFSAIF